MGAQSRKNTNHRSVRAAAILAASAALGANCAFAQVETLPASARGALSSQPPRVDGVREAQGSAVVINQVDTSGFPQVRLFATVLKGGTPQIGLSAEDFRVREDEVDQEPLTVIPKLTPLSLVVALDTSGSMHKAIGAAKLAAANFVDRLGSEDQVATLGFARQVSVLNTFTTDRELVKQAIASTSARGDTALYDALYRSVEVLQTRPGRKAIVLLSDGRDDDGTGSQLSGRSITDVLQLAKQVNVPIFIVGLGSEIDRRTLQTVAESTGASVLEAPDAEQLQSIYDRIGSQLSGQYNISYRSNLPADGSTHRIQLTHAGSSGSKEYVVAGVAAPKWLPPAPAAQPVAQPAARAPGNRSEYGIRTKGGLSFDSAEPIILNETYHFDERSGEENYVRYFAIEATPGRQYNLFVQNAGTDAVEAKILDSRRKQIAQTYVGHSSWSNGSNEWSVNRESGGRYFLQIESKGPVVFGAIESDRSDAGSLTDAGAEEDTALAIPLGKVVTGTLNSPFDRSDRFRIDVPEGMSVAVKVRPSANLSVRVSGSDGNGKTLKVETSNNRGALAKLIATGVSGGVLFIDISDSSSDDGSYNLIVDDVANDTNQGPSAPKQPEEPVLPLREKPGA